MAKNGTRGMGNQMKRSEPTVTHRVHANGGQSENLRPQRERRIRQRIAPVAGGTGEIAGMGAVPRLEIGMPL